MQHQLNMKSYPPVWLMMMRYRDIMGKRDATYKLSQQLEMDVAYFPTSKVVQTDEGKNVVLQKLQFSSWQKANQLMKFYLHTCLISQIMSLSIKPRNC